MRERRLESAGERRSRALRQALGKVFQIGLILIAKNNCPEPVERPTRKRGSIPNGDMSHSLGLAQSAYPGNPVMDQSTPTGLCPQVTHIPFGTQPRWGSKSFSPVPRVAAMRQPWAVGRNPLGIQDVAHCQNPFSGTNRHPNCLRLCDSGLCRFPPSSLMLAPRSKSLPHPISTITCGNQY